MGGTMKRLLCWGVAAYIIGIFSARFFAVEYLIRIGFVIGIAFVIKMVLGKGKRYYFLMLLFGCALLGILRFEIVDDVYLKPIGPFLDKPVTFTCKVITAPVRKNEKLDYIVRISRIETDETVYPVTAKVKLSCVVRGPADIYEYGDILQVKSKLYVPADTMNTGGFDYNDYLKAQGIYAITFATPYQIKRLEGQQQRRSVEDFSFYLRKSVINRIDQFLPQHEAALLKGMMVGDRTDFTEQMKEDFSKSGLSHLVAVSGMHVAILLMGITYVLSILKVNKHAAKVIGIIAVVQFMFMTGCTPSVVRAGIMAVIFLAAYLLNRERDALTSLFLSALIMLAYNPMVLFHVGFQLSFCATLSLLILYQPIYAQFGFLNGRLGRQGAFFRIPVQVIVASITAQLGTMPLVAYHFNRVSVVSVASNLVVVPLTSIVLIAGMLLCLAGSVSIFLGNLAAGFVYVFLKFILTVSHFLAALPFAAITVPSPNILFAILYLFALFVLYHLLQKVKNAFRIKLVSLLVTITLISSIIFTFWQSDFAEVTFINVGQGDCIFVKCSEDKTMLIDGGGRGGEDGYDVGKYIVMPYLLKRGIRHIDLAIVSHYHADHGKGIISILENMSVGALILPPREEENALKQALIDAANARQIPVYYLLKGDEIDLSKKTNIQVLAPGIEQLTDDAFNENDNSFVLKFNYGQMDFLFTGDIEKYAEQYIMKNRQVLRADVLKVPHHGSDTSTTNEFLDAVSPRYAVVTVGRNTFGHPHPQVLERLKNKDIKVFRTDVNGTITFITDNRKIKKVKLLREGE